MLSRWERSKSVRDDDASLSLQDIPAARALVKPLVMTWTADAYLSSNYSPPNARRFLYLFRSTLASSHRQVSRCVWQPCWVSRAGKTNQKNPRAPERFPRNPPRFHFAGCAFQSSPNRAHTFDVKVSHLLTLEMVSFFERALKSC